MYNGALSERRACGVATGCATTPQLTKVSTKLLWGDLGHSAVVHPAKLSRRIRALLPHKTRLFRDTTTSTQARSSATAMANCGPRGNPAAKGSSDTAQRSFHYARKSSLTFPRLRPGNDGCTQQYLAMSSNSDLKPHHLATRKSCGNSS